MNKMKKKKSLLYIYACICLMSATILSPYGAASQTTERPRFEIESDPLAFIFSGYSLHAAITYSGFRSSLGIFAIESPEFLLQNDAFSVYTSGYDFKTDYLFGELKGFYTGIQLTYTKDEIELKEGESVTDKLRGLNIGLRAGYRFMFGKKEKQYQGFYLTP
jgi:hypothetical protein